MAYEESHFRPEVIAGTKTSSAGALGILQLMPQFFQTVRVPTPFTTADTVAQISEAAHFIVSLYNRFQDWGIALAAYNWGAGNVQKYIAGTAQLPSETSTYVSEILTDVPLPTAMAV
jgi:soluble lytic murein transglycosylase-like protein